MQRKDCSNTTTETKSCTHANAIKIEQERGAGNYYRLDRLRTEEGQPNVVKVSKVAKIRNRYIQVPHLTQDKTYYPRALQHPYLEADARVT